MTISIFLWGRNKEASKMSLNEAINGSSGSYLRAQYLRLQIQVVKILNNWF